MVILTVLRLIWLCLLNKLFALNLKRFFALKYNAHPHVWVDAGLGLVPNDPLPERNFIDALGSTKHAQLNLEHMEL